MCRSVFLGARGPLPEIPYSEQAPAMHIRRMDKTDIDHDRMERILCTPFIYDIGGFMGCACSLGYDLAYIDPRDPEKMKEHTSSVSDVKALFQYLIEHSPRVELKLFVT